MQKRPIVEVVADSLARHIKKREISANQLGKMAKVSPRTIANFLKPGERDTGKSGKAPSGKLTELEMICHALGTDVPGLIAPYLNVSPSQSDTTQAGIDARQETDSTEAHAASHSQLQHPPTGVAVGAGQKPPVSFDVVFEKMRPSEQRRLMLMFAAAFDEPPDVAEHGGITSWTEPIEGQSPQANKGTKTNISRARGAAPRKRK